MFSNNEHDILKEEYQMLREEMMYRIKTREDTILYAITLYCTIQFFALKDNIPYISLLIYIVLSILQIKIFVLRWNIRKISAYMQVFLEPYTAYKWETRWRKFIVKQRVNEQGEEGNMKLLPHYIFQMLAVVTFLLFLIIAAKNYRFTLDINAVNFEKTSELVLQFLGVYLVFKVDQICKKKDKLKEDLYLNFWNKIKDEDNSSMVSEDIPSNG